MEHYMKTEPDIRLTPRQCQCWSCKANRSKCRTCGEADPEFWGYCNSCWEARVDELTPPVEQAMAEGYKTMALNHTKAEFEAHKEWGKPTGAEADAIEKATCTCHIDDGPACPVHVALQVGDTVCITCDGRGQIFVDVLEDRNVLAETCWECKGTGKMCETDGQQGE